MADSYVKFMVYMYWSNSLACFLSFLIIAVAALCAADQSGNPAAYKAEVGKLRPMDRIRPSNWFESAHKKFKKNPWFSLECDPPAGFFYTHTTVFAYLLDNAVFQSP